MATKSQIQRRSGINPLSYLGVDPISPGNLVQQTFAPTTNDLSFNIGDMWVVTPAPYSVWMLVNKADFTATWIQLNGGGGGSGIQTITGDAGGAVGPNGSGNINLQGAGPYVFTGNPGANLLTLSDDGTLAYTYTTDSGVATPSSNNLNIVGAGIISTSAVGDTVTITAAGSVPVSIVVDSGGPVTPVAGVLDVLGGNNITTSGAGNTIHVNVTGTTNHAVQIGNSTGSLTSLAIGTDGQVLIGATGANPAFANLTSGDGSITFTVGPNSLDLKAAGAGPGVTTIHTDSGNAAPSGGTLNVYGDASHIQTTGAGNTVTAELYGFTDNAPVVGNALGSLDSLSPMTTGELMIGVTGSAPNLARLLAGSNITIDDTSSPGNITISSSGGGGGGIIKTTFTSSGDWYPNANMVYAYIQMWSGGGGGASGASGGYVISGSNQVFNAGTGGAARGASFYLLPKSAFNFFENVHIGAGGAGGASVTSGGSTVYGNAGANSGTTQIGLVLIAGRQDYQYISNFNTNPATFTNVPYFSGGGAPTNISGTGKAPQPGWVYLNTAPNTALQFVNINNQGNTQSFVDNGGGFSGGSAAFVNVLPYLIGVGGNSYASATPIGAPTSGGGGGVMTYDGLTYTSSPGGYGGGIWNMNNTYIQTGGAGGTPGNPGSNGWDASVLTQIGILSGGLGGGGGSVAGGGVNGQNGGNGGFPGGAGGGGSPCSLGFTSGAGGDGADGYVVIYEFLSGSGSILFNWLVVTVNTLMASNIGYIANSGSLITLTLPTTAAIGDIIKVTGKGAGGWTIAQNAGQFIQFGSVTTTTGVGGSLSSNDPSDSVELVCVTTDTEWLVLSSVGTLIYV